VADHFLKPVSDRDASVHTPGDIMHIDEPVILIRLTESFKPGMAGVALYDATRGSWRMNPSRHNPVYAFAVNEGIVQEVYRITRWEPGGSSVYPTRPYMKPTPGRWEFVGSVADESIRRKYLDKSVAEYLAGQNPIRYVNC
jgi:uncharacterized protein